MQAFCNVIYYIARRAGQFWPGQVVRGKVCVGPRVSAVKKGFFVLKKATEINRRRTRTDADKRLFVSADLAETRFLALRAGVSSEHSHPSMNFVINETSPNIDKTMRGFIARRADGFFHGQVVRGKGLRSSA